MKKIVMGFCLLASASAFSAHGPSGCGLGSVVFKGKSGLLFHVIAATTNGSSGNQTFGMSTGTLGCEDASTAKVAAVDFIENNRQGLINDVAVGGGETLSAYLSIIDRPQADVTKIQAHFASIFSPENSAVEIHSTLLGVI